MAKNHGEGTPYTRCVRATTEAFASFQRFKVYSVSRRRSLRGGGHGFATVGKSDKQPGGGGEEEEEEVSSSRANRARSASAYKPFYLYAARLIN